MNDNRITQSRYQSLNYKGEKFDSKYESGPKGFRICTDIFCLAIFAGFWAGLVIFGLYGFSSGNPTTLTSVYDQNGTPCGQSKNSGYSFLYWIKNHETLDITNTVCVKACPSSEDDIVQCSKYSSALCSDANSDIYATDGIGGKVCIPSNSTLFKTLDKDVDVDFWQKSVNDVQETWWVNLVVAAIALVLGFLYIALMRYCAGFIVWSLIVCYILGLGGFGALCWAEAIGEVTVSSSTFSTLTPETLKIIAIGSWVLGLVSLIIMLVFCSRINLAIAVIKCAADFVEATPGIILVTPLIFIFSIVFYLFWIYAFVYIVSTNEMTAKNGYPFVSITWASSNIGMVIYYVFGLIWNHAFLNALSTFIIASSVVLWYFRKATSRPPAPVATSICRALFSHIGSIAMGSFAVAIVDFFRMLVSFFHGHMRAAREQRENRAFRWCCCCNECCLDCFERFLRFINRHAYVQIAMTGKSFCASAEDAFFMMLRNSISFGFVHGLAGGIVFVGKIFITFIGAFVGYLIITKTQAFKDSVYSPAVPGIFFLLIALIIANNLLSIYGVSADAVIHCYIMDEEIHNGAVHAPDSLTDFVSKHVDKSKMGQMEKQLVNGNNSSYLSDSEVYGAQK